MKKLTLLCLTFICGQSFAQDQKTRIENTYIKNDQRFELACYYFNPSNFKLITPLTKTQRKYGELKRTYKVDSNNSSFNFTYRVLSSDKKEGQYIFSFDNGLTISGVKSSKSSMLYNNGKNAFYLPTKKIDRKYKNFAFKNELYKISCRVNFAVEEKTPITSDWPLHFNVHPHDKYDVFGETIQNTEKYYNNPAYKSYVLLEEGNFKGNLVDFSDFLEMKKYTLIKNYYPESVAIPLHVDLKVSPAGHNRYDFKGQGKVDITYTGGYHNYCMWNNTRRVLMSLMRSKSEAQLNINYDTETIIVNNSGLVGLNLSSSSMKDGKLIKTVFANDSKQAKEYTKKYFTYFSDIFFSVYKGMFSKVILRNHSRYGDYEKEIRGQGSRVLEINLNYINL